MISGNIELLPFPIYYDMPRSCLHLATQREGEGKKTIFVFIFTSFSLIHQKVILFVQLHRITFFLCFYTLYLRLNWYGDIARYTLCFCIALWHDLHKRAAMCPTETYSKYFFPPQKLKKKIPWVKSGGCFISGDWGLCARHPGIDNHSPVDNKWSSIPPRPGFLCSEVRGDERSTCASNDTGNDEKYLEKSTNAVTSSKLTNNLMDSPVYQKIF